MIESHYQNYEKKLAVKAILARVEACLADRRDQFKLLEKSVAFVDYIVEIKEVQLDAIQLDDLELAILKLDDSLAEVQDPLQEVNLGDENEHKPTFISQLLEPKFQTKLIELLREYQDCFAWGCDEMPGLSQELVEHRLPIREACRLFK